MNKFFDRNFKKAALVAGTFGVTVGGYVVAGVASLVVIGLVIAIVRKL